MLSCILSLDAGWDASSIQSFDAGMFSVIPRLEIRTLSCTISLDVGMLSCILNLDAGRDAFLHPELRRRLGCFLGQILASKVLMQGCFLSSRG
jgi:hypothetical protein